MKIALRASMPKTAFCIGKKSFQLSNVRNKIFGSDYAILAVDRQTLRADSLEKLAVSQSPLVNANKHFRSEPARPSAQQIIEIHRQSPQSQL